MLLIQAFCSSFVIAGGEHSVILDISRVEFCSEKASEVFFLCVAVVPGNFSYELRSALYKGTNKWSFPLMDLEFLLGLIIFANMR